MNTYYKHVHTAQYITVLYSTVQYSTAQYSAVQYVTVRYSTVQYSTVQYSTVQYLRAPEDCLLLSAIQIVLNRKKGINYKMERNDG